MSDRIPLLTHGSQGEGSGQSSFQRLTVGYQRARKATHQALESKAKHWAILFLIILDICGILTDIFIALITCELDRENEPWVGPTRSGLTTMSLVLSCLFLLELTLSLWADGFTYFNNWSHTFDAIVIIFSFFIDLIENGVESEIASLIVILRLWRIVKIANEFNLEASEQMDDLREKAEALEKENADLKAELRKYRPHHDEEEGRA